jgi:hypothetical protein
MIRQSSTGVTREPQVDSRIQKLLDTRLAEAERHEQYFLDLETANKAKAQSGAPLPPQFNDAAVAARERRAIECYRALQTLVDTTRRSLEEQGGNRNLEEQKVYKNKVHGLLLKYLNAVNTIKIGQPRLTAAIDAPSQPPIGDPITRALVRLGDRIDDIKEKRTEGTSLQKLGRIGGSAFGGALAGAALGAIGGPIGIAVGAILGATIAGGLMAVAVDFGMKDIKTLWGQFKKAVGITKPGPDVGQSSPAPTNQAQPDLSADRAAVQTQRESQRLSSGATALQTFTAAAKTQAAASPRASVTPDSRPVSVYDLDNPNPSPTRSDRNTTVLLADALDAVVRATPDASIASPQKAGSDIIAETDKVLADAEASDVKLRAFLEDEVDPLLSETPAASVVNPQEVVPDVLADIDKVLADAEASEAKARAILAEADSVLGEASTASAASTLESVAIAAPTQSPASPTEGKDAAEPGGDSTNEAVADLEALLAETKRSTRIPADAPGEPLPTIASQQNQAPAASTSEQKPTSPAP